jgi:hypothetical protein
VKRFRSIRCSCGSKDDVLSVCGTLRCWWCRRDAPPETIAIALMLCMYQGWYLYHETDSNDFWVAGPPRQGYKLFIPGSKYVASNVTPPGEQELWLNTFVELWARPWSVKERAGFIQVDSTWITEGHTLREAVEMLNYVEPDKVRQMFKQGAVKLNGEQCKDERRVLTDEDFKERYYLFDSRECLVWVGKTHRYGLILFDPDPVEPTECARCNFMRIADPWASCPRQPVGH